MKTMKFLYLLLLLMFHVLTVQAATSYEEALQAGADDIGAQNYADARIDYNEAMALAKTDFEKNTVRLSLGQLEMIEKEYISAIKQFEQVLASDNDDITIRFMALQGIGQSYVAEKKYDRGRKEYQKALVIDDMNLSLKSIVQLNIAMSYFSEENYPQARDEFDKLLDYKDAVPETLISVPVLVGKCYLAEGNARKAREEFIKVLAFNGKKFNTAETKGKVIPQSVINLGKNQAQLSIADSYFYEENYTQAKTEYSKILRIEKLNPLAKTQAEKRLNLIKQLEEQKNKEVQK